VYPAVQFGGNNRLWVAFSNLDYWSGGLAPGIVVWREK
jgi:hypothetical protein